MTRSEGHHGSPSPRPPAGSPPGERFTAWRPGMLDRYVLGKFAWLWLGNLLCFGLVYCFIDAFENLDTFLGRAHTAGELARMAARYYLAVLPVVFCQLLGPVVALTAGLFTMTLLQRSNEIVPVLACGRPLWRLVLPIFGAGLVIALGTFLLQELWIPRTGDAIRELVGRRTGSTVLKDQKYWDREHGRLIVLKRYDVLSRTAEGVTVIPGEAIERGGPGRSEFYILARSMQWIEPELEGEGYWLLREAKVQEYRGRDLLPPPFDGPRGTVPPLVANLPELQLRTSLIPEDIEARREDVVHMRLADLWHKMRSGPDRRWTVKFHSRLAVPLAALVLLLVGLPVISYFGSRNVFVGALASALIASGFFVVGAMATDLALRGFLVASLGPWLAPLSFASAGLAMLRYGRS